MSDVQPQDTPPVEEPVEPPVEEPVEPPVEPPVDSIANRVNKAAEANTVEVPPGSGVDADAPVPVGTGMATSTLGAQSVVQAVANGEVEGDVAPATAAAAEDLAASYE